ncbi:MULTISPECIES: mannose/fructose/sorbose PTS transporter subunit IIB [Enterococcus]|uniref:PTS fructose transporter subunit IIB n=2 Tax=root TaxID=1 RepID=A0A179EUM1_ENTTH|nr:MULTISPECIES: mannose/fructose/sorbose PTS transporter subunit IIB [Enterococcus]ASZ08010.1 PTS fructose transporter subunit IIB [Enterococcus thailandicus]MDA3964169.1 mannose/fructose/sorbose PTS transporter subunit IIB [Enterococcus thailandicus]MDA3973405.1 mannose/fructose/sorbose PTS transporter subunit IIB [Enterococcus thailandicus]MDA3976010.1 mannose/fructose/sorbose PTS transporter subunit IIB [Enterococcus thailandicus]MDA3980864.1 mannose/fructose/sorbose PTS transporter subuni
MDIRLARIDDRLIHGQVATAWSKSTGVERIIVVSDMVAKDDLRKFLLKEAAPPGIHANVITVQKMIQVYQSGLLANAKVMLLFTNPQDVEAIVRCGVQLSSLNIGGMSFTDGKTMITNFVSVNQRDIEAFNYLDSQKVELEIRKVPADRKVLLMELLAKAKKA